MGPAYPFARGCPESGVSLVELLVAMLLGILLSSAVVGAYLASKRQYFHTEQVARMQENGRYAQRLLSRELGMVGFYGGLHAVDTLLPAVVGGDCIAGNWALNNAPPLDYVNDFPGDTAPASALALVFTCLEHSAIQTDTDLLAIRRTAAEPAARQGVVAGNLGRSTAQKWYLRLAPGQYPKWQQQRPVDFFDAEKLDTSASYWQAIAKLFFIRNYSDSPGDGVPSLCMATLAGDFFTTRCLVEGVENLQLEFGIDSDFDGVANRYVGNPGAAEMGHAVAVRIHLLLRSIRPVVGKHNTRSYILGNRVVPAQDDAYLRRVYSRTVRLVNHHRPYA